MWLRRTYHECAAELAQISEQFRLAYTKAGPWDAAQCEAIMHETSVRGVEILRILALSIRSDQDYGLVSREPTRVGAFRNGISSADVGSVGESYRPPYSELPGFSQLNLRDALNKIAHASPAGNGFYADNDSHDLLLTGTLGATPWLAVVSLVDLCNTIASMPDAQIKRA